MSLKKQIKRILGPQGLYAVRRVKAQLVYLRRRCAGQHKALVMHSTRWSEPRTFSQPGRHVFFGYYDLQQLDADDTRMLVTVIPGHADAMRDEAELGWYDLSDGQYHAITATRAWCWQQGARLRWHPVLPDAILFNDVEDDRYVTCTADIMTGKRTRLAGRACYDVTPDMSHGLSLNYSRLQRLRPGYGYGRLPDKTIGEKVPASDGIFLVDLERDESRLIISYEQLVKLSPGSEEEWNYINHISFAPSGERFMFFHLWTPGIGERWRAKLYVANTDGSGLRCLEGEYTTSHYCWKDDRTLLTTTVPDENGRSYYMTYDVDTGVRTLLGSEHLNHDGHPSFMRDGDHFIADTYPLNHCMQQLFFRSRQSRGLFAHLRAVF